MILGISGKKYSGKDTVGKLIQQYYPEQDWQIKKYAGVLKETAGLILNVFPDRFEDEKFKNSLLGTEWDKIIYLCPNCEKDAGSNVDNPCPTCFEQREAVVQKMTVRKFLQLLGTEGGRSVHPNLWINALFSNYVSIPVHQEGDEHAEYKYPNWVITDVRFPNEAQEIKRRGGKLIRIERNDLLRLGYVDKDSHPSETALDNFTDWDAIVDNNDTKESLEKSIQSLGNFLFSPTTIKYY